MYCAFHENVPAVGTCVRCGKPVCEACKREKDGRIYCVHCAAIPTTEKSKIVAALLALFLGTLGIHRFYLGQPVLGVIYLLCTFPGFLLLGIPTIIIGIISFIDAVVLLCMSDEAFADKYGKSASA